VPYISRIYRLYILSIIVYSALGALG